MFAANITLSEKHRYQFNLYKIIFLFLKFKKNKRYLNLNHTIQYNRDEKCQLTLTEDFRIYLNPIADVLQTDFAIVAIENSGEFRPV